MELNPTHLERIAEGSWEICRVYGEERLSSDTEQEILAVAFRWRASGLIQAWGYEEGKTKVS